MLLLSNTQGSYVKCMWKHSLYHLLCHAVQCHPSLLQIEADVQFARLLAGLQSTRARKEVSERANSVLEAGLQLLLLEDKLTAMMEAAQVLVRAYRASSRYRLFGSQLIVLLQGL